MWRRWSSASVSAPSSISTHSADVCEVREVKRSTKPAPQDPRVLPESTAATETPLEAGLLKRRAPPTGNSLIPAGPLTPPIGSYGS